MRTTDLWDAHPNAFRLVEGDFRDFGGKRRFHGPIMTLRVHEDNALVRRALESSGNGRVLVIDGGGSLRRALVGGNLGKLAEQYGWAGILVNGAVRDSVELVESAIGVKALGLVPAKSEKLGKGEEAVDITFGGCTFHVGDFLYADEDGVIVSDRAYFA